jgi:hypothetical protein
MGDASRHSQALEAELVSDPEARALLEVQNGLKQFQLVTDMVEQYLAPDRPFKFRPSHLQALQRAALQGLSSYAGTWRPVRIAIEGSRHALQMPSGSRS